MLDSLTKGVAKPGPNVPLPESTAGLEWSSLVNVATKAIEGTGQYTQVGCFLEMEKNIDFSSRMPLCIYVSSVVSRGEFFIQLIRVSHNRMYVCGYLRIFMKICDNNSG